MRGPEAPNEEVQRCRRRARPRPAAHKPVHLRHNLMIRVPLYLGVDSLNSILGRACFPAHERIACMNPCAEQRRRGRATKDLSGVLVSSREGTLAGIAI